MSSYLGRHAELYDLFYADKPYAAEADFVHECLQQFGAGEVQRVLELACGTGNHAFEFEKHGYQVIATDYSEDMLARAQNKADERGSQIEFRLGDMRTLDVPEKPFDAVVCLFDSIGYVQTNQAIGQVLDGVHQHLRPGGLFVFEFWHAAAMLRGYDPLRVRRWTLPEGELLRLSETTLQYDRQLAHVTYTIYELNADGTYAHLQETQTNRYFLLQEMANWLEHFSFDTLKWYAGFQNDERITDDTWHIVVVAQRRDA
jgi:SAM-dependent methyltransferase